MKVAIVAESIYTFMSGAAVFTKRLIDQLSMREDIEEVIVITAGEKNDIKIEGKKKIYFFKALEFDIFKNFPLTLTKLKNIKNILKEEKVDIVHLQLPSPLCIAAGYYARQEGIPIVTTSHTQPDNILINFKIRSKHSKRIFYRYITFLYNFSDYIIFPSEHARKEANLNGLGKNLLNEVISNGIDIYKFSPAKKRQKRILFVGRLMKEKCIPTFIEASAIVSRIHPEYEFIIAGDGYLKESLKELANKINPKIRFTGFISDEELVKLYQTSQIFVLPSESELQGIVLLEAMSTGMVTIASDSEKSAARELANYTFKHKDSNDLANKILYLIENPKKVILLSKENRINISKDHNYKKIISSYIDAYHKAINIHRNKKPDKGKRKLKKVSLPFLYGYLSSRYMNNNYPLWIDFRVTSRCNLRCIYCDIPNQKLDEMSFPEIKTVLNKIDTKSFILLTGGEPLVRKDIGEIIDYIVFNTGHTVILNTNLLLLKEMYDKVKNCDGFYFSLDGTKDTHEKNKGKGTWNKVIDSLELLNSEKRGKISMTVITSNTTLEDIKTVLYFSKKYNILPAFQLVRHYEKSGKSKSFSPEKENAFKILDYLINQRKKGFIMMNSVKGLIAQKKILEDTLNTPCFSGRLFVTIDSDGVVGLCFSRPRNKEFLNLLDKNVNFKQALESLRKIKPHTIRCPGCSCMAPIEFALADLFNLDVIAHNNQSFSRFMKLENDYTKKQKTCNDGR